MAIFDFLKRNKENVGKQGADSTVDSKDLFGVEGTDTGREVKTALSFPPNAKITPEDRYYFQFLNNELTPLKENQVSLSGIELKVEDGKVMITAFVRNSLPKAIEFRGATPLLLLGPNDEVIARQEFDLTQIGEIPAESSRPWGFLFEEKNVKVAEIPQTDWKLAFELEKEKGPHALDLEESWEKSLAEKDKEQLENLVKGMTPPKPGEVNFMGIQARLAEKDGSLHVTILIRNGSENNLSLQQIPLVVEDASGDVIAKGGFKLEKLNVKANTSKPWTFIFPKEMLLKEEIDLSKWKAYPPQK